MFLLEEGIMPRNTGFSLLEVMMAVGITAFCLVPVMVFSQRGLTESAFTRQEILGRMLLIDFCERFKSCRIEELKKVASSLAGNPHYLDSDDYLIPRKSMCPQFLKDIQRSLTVEENAKDKNGTPVNALHIVRFGVKFTRTGGVRDHERELFVERLVHEHVTP